MLVPLIEVIVHQKTARTIVPHRAVEEVMTPANVVDLRASQVAEIALNQRVEANQ